MYKQIVTTYTYDGSGGPYNYPADWFPINVAGYDTVAITIQAPTGWIGTISFWGGATTDETSPALWSLNDAEDASLVSQVETVVGATPSEYTHNFRGSIAGLAEIGIYFASPTTFESVVGTAIKVSVGLYTSAK
jgi:hypothetical protein